VQHQYELRSKMANDKIIAFPPLDAKLEYYSDWVVRMQIKLEEKLCYYAVEHDPPVADADGEELDPEILADFNQQNNKAHAQIAKHLGPYALNIIKPYIHLATAMWEALRMAYSNKSASNQANLLVKPLTTKMSESDAIENLCNHG